MVYLKYFLVRIILYYIFRLDNILIEEKNVFNLKNFEEFVQTDFYKFLKNQVQADKTFWDAEHTKLGDPIFNKNFKDIPQVIWQGSSKEIVIDYKQDYYSVPDDFKLPSRAVFLTCFAKVYKKANRFLRHEETVSRLIKD